MDAFLVDVTNEGLRARRGYPASAASRCVGGKKAGVAQLNRNYANEIAEILIVDDDAEFIRDLLAAWIPAAPVAVANSGKEAVEYLSERMPSLVLLDLMLPHYLAPRDDMEGLSILKYVKARYGKRCPVIVLSKESSPRMRERVKSLEAAGFVGKPVSIKLLEESIARSKTVRR
jgi:CheY-like chemotaxis protein